MQRTNIYLEGDQLRLLKHVAVEEGRSFTELVRQALQEFLERYPAKNGAASCRGRVEPPSGAASRSGAPTDQRFLT